MSGFLLPKPMLNTAGAYIILYLEFLDCGYEGRVTVC